MPAEENGTATVKSFRPFEDLSEKEADEVRHHAEAVHFEKGHVIFRQGDPGFNMYLLVAGEVSITVAVPTYDDYLLATLSPGSVFGEIGLLLDEARNATATATADVQLWKIPRIAFQAALQAHEGWATALLLVTARDLARRLTKLDDQLVKLLASRHGKPMSAEQQEVAELDRLREMLFSRWSF